MTNAEHDKDMIESIEMWLHEIEPKWVEKELAWLDELRTRLLEEDAPDDLEEPVCEELNEAAKAYTDARDWAKENYLTPYIRQAFKAGANWQKTHDAELIEIAYNDGITIGMTKQKKQMMKEAVDGTVYGNGDYTWVAGDIPSQFKYGDKVRIIIVKEDEK